MKPVSVSDPSGLNFRVTSPLAVVRDLLIIALCAALIGGFLAQVWNRPAPSDARAGSAPAVSATLG